MNQILVNTIHVKKNKNIYLTQFIIIILLLFWTITNLIYQKYIEIRNQDVSKLTLNNYLLSKLYNESTNNSLLIKNDKVYVIGEINIPKINLSYPIFSSYSDNLLKFSVCKFSGPNPGEAGNLCIVGHNYNNDMFFSNLSFLNNNDKIYIINNKKEITAYSVYKIYETSPDDLSYVLQNKIGISELTLITCNNSNKQRIIVKAKKEGNN